MPCLFPCGAPLGVGLPHFTRPPQGAGPEIGCFRIHRIGDDRVGWVGADSGGLAAWGVAWCFFVVDLQIGTLRGIGRAPLGE